MSDISPKNESSKQQTGVDATMRSPRRLPVTLVLSLLAVVFFVQAFRASTEFWLLCSFVMALFAMLSWGIRHDRRRFWSQGEPMVWATGGAMSTVLMAAAVVLIVVLANGLTVFWPSELVAFKFRDGRELLGRVATRQTNPDTREPEIRLKTANRNFEPDRQDFHWVLEKDIAERSRPTDVYILERLTGGDFYGYLRSLKVPGVDLPSDASLDRQFQAALAVVEKQRASDVQPVIDRTADAGAQLHALDLEIGRLEYRKKQAVSLVPPPADRIAVWETQIKELQAQKAVVQRSTEQFVAERSKQEKLLQCHIAQFADAHGKLHDIALADIVRAYQPNAMGFVGKAGHYGAKVIELLTTAPRESNTEGGLLPAIFGTVTLILLMALCSFPLGVLAGVYLGDYARDGVLVRLVRIGVNNLAGIPSIVYGIFGVGFFIDIVGHGIDQNFFPDRLANGPVFGTGGVLWASITLGILTVPVVIVATEEAIRVIPRGVRESSYALGATKFQTLVRVIIPLASPGMMTGFILAMARAAGEVAPLMITGVVNSANDLPIDGHAPFLHLDRKFMHLGYHIYDVAFQSPNVEASLPMVYVTTMMLVLIVLVLSGLAIMLRNRMRRKMQLRTI